MKPIRYISTVVALVLSIAAAQGALAITMTHGLLTPLSGTDGTLTVKSAADYVQILGGYTSPEAFKMFDEPIFTARVFYDINNDLGTLAPIESFTVYYSSTIGPSIICVSLPSGYVDDAGTFTYLGGTGHSVMLNVGYGSYDYDTGAPWTVEYYADHITFRARPGVTALPYARAVGVTSTSAGRGFELCFASSLNFAEVTGSSHPEASPAVLKGQVIGPVVDAAPTMSLAQAKALPDGSRVKIYDLVCTARFPSSSYWYMEEAGRQGGLRVVSDTQVPVGINSPVEGVMSTVYAERELRCFRYGGWATGPDIRPLFMTNRALGGGAFGQQIAIPPGNIGVNNVGLLVKTSGRVTDRFDWGAFFIDDGSGLTDAVRPGLTVTSTNVTIQAPPKNAQVAVTGISGAETLSGVPIRTLRPRSNGEISIARLPVAFVHGGDLTAANEFAGLLSSQNIYADLMTVTDAAAADFSKYSAIIVSNDSGFMDAWGTTAAVDHIVASGLPVLGIGDGGYAFFGKVGLNIGYPNGAHTSYQSMYAYNPFSSFYSYANAMTIPGDYTFKLFFVAVDVTQLHLYPVPAGVVPLGRNPTTGDDYPVCWETPHYVYWGYTASPSVMTAEGKNLFINSLWYAMK